jgi:hypothetical protein
LPPGKARATKLQPSSSLLGSLHQVESIQTYPVKKSDDGQLKAGTKASGFELSQITPLSPLRPLGVQPV